MKTALIIDDDERCRAPAAQRLRSLGWEVVEADSGEQGLDFAIKRQPAVILCNLLMPHGNGYQLCRSVREQLDLKHTRLVAISALGYPSDRVSAMEAGADEVVTKGELLEQLEQIVSRTNDNQAATATNGTGSPVSTSAVPVNGGNSATRLRFWGVRGSIPTPGAATVGYGGNTSCVEVRADGEIIVMDAGSGLRLLGVSLTKEFPGQPLHLTVLVSHTHWDHIQGFPFFMPAYNPANKIRILGYEGARAGLGATLALQMESPYFPITMRQMPSHIVIEELREMTFKVGEVPVEACFSKHPGVCVGYRLTTSGGSIIYLPDNEWSSEDRTDECPEGCSRNAKLVQFIRGVDVLIIDAQYDREEYESHKGWGHGCLDDVVRLAISCEVKRLFLFHHDPQHDDAKIDSMLAHARSIAREQGSPIAIEAAREGAEVVLEAKGAAK